MLIDFNYLKNEYGLNITGLIQVGCHYAEEYMFFKENNIPKMIFFEPVKESFEVMKCVIGNDSSVTMVQKALSDKVGRMKMFIESYNNGQSSSLLQPEKHIEFYPDIVFDKEEIVDVDILDNYNTEEYNALWLDCQGAEGLILKGAEKTLEHIDYIYSELNFEHLYKDCALVGDIDKFLSKFGFLRVETVWTDNSWGDGFYVKKIN
jgi:FkbM family methyltransferase